MQPHDGSIQVDDSRSDEKSNEKILLTHDGSIQVDDLCSFLEEKLSEIREAFVVSLAAKYFLHITFCSGVTISQVKDVCSKFLCLHTSAGKIEAIDSSPEISMLLDRAKVDRNLFRWTKSEKIHGETPRTFGEMNKIRGRAENALNALLRCLDASGNFDQSKFLSTTPPTKPKLLYSELSSSNAGQFCDDAAATVIWNIYKSCSSSAAYFSEYRIADTARAVLEIASKRDVESGLALSMLVHWSKCSSDEIIKAFCLALITLRAQPLALAKLNQAEERIATEAKEFLKSASLSKLLLENTGFTDSSVLDRIKIHYVNMEIEGVKGWAAPGSFVVNLYCLRSTKYLKKFGPTIALFGHESRHVVFIMANGGDLNFSAPENAEMATPSLATPNRESGYWFELRAIGGKFRYPNAAEELSTAVEDGLRAGRVPALTEAQVVRYSIFCTDPNVELAFDYEPPCDFCC